MVHLRFRNKKTTIKTATQDVERARRGSGEKMTNIFFSMKNKIVNTVIQRTNDV